MSLYGYKLPTTPNLDKLAKSQNLYVFSDIISPHTHTAPVLERLLTFSNYENRATPWYEQMNIIDVMRLSGFETIWLSNQERVSVWGNVAEIIAKRANSQFFSNVAFHSPQKDEILLKMYDKISPKFKPNSDKFIIFHLMGTHGGYEHRYPKDFAKFSGEILHENGLDKFYNKEAKTLNNHQVQTRANYANAVLYNDFVVSEIMAKFKDEDAIIFYLSDHCDEVFDHRDFVAHEWDFASRFMVEIPFMIFMSDKFKEKRPRIVQSVENALHKPFMTDNFIHAFLDLLGIKYDEMDESLSLFSPKFNASRARIVANKFDYDLELKDAQNAFLAPDKVWLHRTNELKKVEDFYGIYQNFEIDVHFFDEEAAKKFGKNAPYFDVGHDGEKDSIGLNLREILALIKQKDDEFKKDTRIKTEFKIWLDFKNLSEKNAANSLSELIKICEDLNLKREKFIVESSSYKALRGFKQSGFYTSYYVPYYDAKELEKPEFRDKTAQNLRHIASSGAVDALSFPYYLYDFMKSLQINIDFLTWNEGQNYFSNARNKAFYDEQIKVILAGEGGEYR